MAKTATAVKNKPSTSVDAPVEEVSKTKERPITLITVGSRTRDRVREGKQLATFGEDTYESQTDLQNAWKEIVLSVPQDDYVIGGGVDGIYTKPFIDQVLQITDLDKVWCPTLGLGMVCMADQYPQIDFGELDGDVGSLLSDENAAFSAAKWWNFACSEFTTTMGDVIKNAMDNGHRVILAMNGQQYHYYKDDLAAFLKDTPIEEIYKHVRLIGAELKTNVPPKLLPCAMPFDREALDRLVPGSRVHGARRMAYLFIKSLPKPRDGRSNLADDKARLEEVFKSDAEPLLYETYSAQKSEPREKVSDETLADLIPKYQKLVGDDPIAIARMLQDEGYSVSRERVADALGVTLEKRVKKEKAKVEETVVDDDADEDAPKPKRGKK